MCEPIGGTLSPSLLSTVCDDVMLEVLRSLSTQELCQFACVSQDAYRLASQAATIHCWTKGYASVEEMSAARFGKLIDDEIMAQEIVHVVQALSYPARTWHEFGQHKELFEQLSALDKLVLEHPRSVLHQLLTCEQTREAVLYNIRILGPDICERHAYGMGAYLSDGYGHSVRAAAIYALNYSGLRAATIELFARPLFHILDTDPCCTSIVGFLLLNFSVSWYEMNAASVASRLQHRDPNVRGWAMHAMSQRLRRTTLEAQATAIAPMLNDGSGYVRHWARQAVAAIVGERLKDYSRAGLQLLPPAPTTLRSLTSANSYAPDWRPVSLPDYEAAMSDILGGKELRAS